MTPFLDDIAFDLLGTYGGNKFFQCTRLEYLVFLSSNDQDRHIGRNFSDIGKSQFVSLASLDQIDWTKFSAYARVLKAGLGYRFVIG